MKKSAIFAAAFVLTLGLAQCKKEQPNAQITEGETVHITVNVNNNGSRADIQDPSTGHYDFKDDDKLYVGYNNAYVGTLDYSTSANKFSGVITISQSGSQRLHFYCLGGSLEPAIDGTEYTVDISDQTSNYPVISYGTSNVDYTGTGTYSTTLLNQCGLVKFNLSTGTDASVSVGGLYTKATIDFANPGTVTPSTEGDITLHSGANNTERWAILLRQENASATATISGYTCSIEETINISDNCYNSTGVSIAMTPTTSSLSSLTIESLEDSWPTIYYSEGETWKQAIDNHPENKDNGWETLIEYGFGFVKYGDYYYLYDGEYNYVDRDSVIDSGEGYNLMN